MDYAAFIRATVPYDSLPQQRYPRTAYHGQPQHAEYPGYDMDARAFMAMSQLHQHQQRQQQQQHQQQQHQHHALAVMAQGDPNRGQPRQNEPKPRLAKDEVDLLEREFTKNSKPNSSTKRDLAERMGVDVARINNWFQNRRAKAKLMMKEQQARERAAAAGDSDSNEEQARSSSEAALPDDARRVSVNLSTAAFVGESEDSSVRAEASASETEHDRAAEGVVASVAESSEQAYAAEESQLSGPVTYASPESLFSSSTSPEVTMPMLTHGFPSSQPPSSTCSVVVSPYMDAQCGPAPLQLRNSVSMLEHLADLSDDALMLGSVDSHMSSGFELHAAASFPSEFLPPAAADEGLFLAHQLQEPETTDKVKSEGNSPAPISQSPPTASDLRLRSPPPPANIATRRNIRRPAPLWLSSSTSPTIGYGPKTCIEPSRPSPMRRIASATGTLSGRIQKPMSASAPRSPFSREAFLQSLQRTQSPVMDSLSGTVSPRLAESEAMSPQPTREATVSSCTSDEDNMFTLNSAHLPLRDHHTIKTPPLTPGFHSTHFEAVFPYGVPGPLGFPHDDSCLTPGLMSNGSDFDLSAAAAGPSYACASQPVTPSFPGHMGPSFWGTLAGNAGANSVEYTFPDSYADLARRASPGPAKTKQFQFTQNVTPQDFHLPK